MSKKAWKGGQREQREAKNENTALGGISAWDAQSGFREISVQEMNGWATLGLCRLNIQKDALQATAQCDSQAHQYPTIRFLEMKEDKEETGIAAPRVITSVVTVLPVKSRDCRAVMCGQVVLEGNMWSFNRPFLTGSCESESGNVGQEMRADPSGVLFNEHYHASRGAGRLRHSSTASWSAWLWYYFLIPQRAYCSWEQTAR
ncbi:hypothetical protein Q8A73_013805 [Channa argus]|nr:hypothetical protein Q8A73_013805 [Channa argus]